MRRYKALCCGSTLFIAVLLFVINVSDDAADEKFTQSPLCLGRNEPSLICITCWTLRDIMLAFLLICCHLLTWTRILATIFILLPAGESFLRNE